MRSEHLDGRVVLHGGDSREVLKTFPDNHFDSVCCDPPYALVSIVKRFGAEGAAPTKDGDVYSRSSSGFMGKQWDTGETAFAVEFWAEIMRVLKPGGHVVAFSGTRTYHRLAVAIEDAGFEIRDQLAWVYGSGFPKSHDVSKGIDKAAGAKREVVGKGASGKNSLMGGLAGTSGESGHDITSPATDTAREWQGWGTALKPAWEPIVMARKPLSGTVAANVLKHGTGALNIDGCRVEGEPTGERRNNVSLGSASGSIYGDAGAFVSQGHELGRWPANIVHDGSDEVVACFPEVGASKASDRGDRPAMIEGGRLLPDGGVRGHNDNGGSAARFYYSAKADKQDRIGSKHPTVKPVDLMQWLCRLVTPPGGTVLDPFAGSGSTGEAAWREGFQCVLIEREPEYQADIAERLRLANAGPIERKARAIKQAPDAGPLFGANDNAPPRGERGGRFTDTSQIRTNDWPDRAQALGVTEIAA